MVTKPLSFRQLKLLWTLVIVFLPMLVWIGEYAAKRAYGGRLTSWHLALVAVGAWLIADGYWFRRKLMMRAIADRGGLGQEAADRKWSLSQVMGLAFASSVALLGIVASIRVGCPRWFRTSFYVTGLVLLILWSPRRPPALLP